MDLSELGSGGPITFRFPKHERLDKKNPDADTHLREHIEAVAGKDTLPAALTERLLILGHNSEFIEGGMRSVENIERLRETLLAQDLSREDIDRAKVATLISDVGKTGGPDTPEPSSRLLVSMFSIDNVSPPAKTVTEFFWSDYAARRFEDAGKEYGALAAATIADISASIRARSLETVAEEHRGNPALSEIFDRIREGIRKNAEEFSRVRFISIENPPNPDTITMAQFWNEHTHATHELLGRSSPQLPAELIPPASLHHLLDGTNPGGMMNPDGSFTRSFGVRTKLEKIDMLVALVDKYDAYRHRSGLSPQDALIQLEKKITASLKSERLMRIADNDTREKIRTMCGEIMEAMKALA